MLFDMLIKIIKFVEVFLDFIEVSDTTSLKLIELIAEKLKHGGLNIHDCRGQAYGNGANMVGKHKGIQKYISDIERTAKFVPSAAHSLNLVSVNIANVSTKMVSFFDIVQQIYLFFYSSTKRWQLLLNLNSNSETESKSKNRKQVKTTLIQDGRMSYFV